MMKRLTAKILQDIVVIRYLQIEYFVEGKYGPSRNHSNRTVMLY